MPINIDADEDVYLYIASSKILNAGQGLFTALEIYKDEIICLYQGNILDPVEIKRKVENNADQYFIEMIDGSILDSSEVECFAKYANDASHNSDAKNNAKIGLDDEGNVCLIATKKLKAGEEIYCSYGARYWQRHG